MIPNIIPGIKTTEFWKSVAVDIAATVLLALHRMTPVEWAALTGGTTGIYTLARTVLKRPSAPNVTVLPAPPS